MSSTIAAQSAEFTVGFNAQIGESLADVFVREQRELDALELATAPVAIGDVVPDAVLLDPTGASTTLAAEIAEAPAVLVFYRGSWCPYCNITLKHYQNELLPALQKRGVKLIAISPQTPEGSETAIANGALEFTVLSDPGNGLIGQLGIQTEPSADARLAHTDLGFDVADSNADATGAIPFPTVLILNSDRTVTFADVKLNYTTRTEVPTILAALDGV